MPNTKEFILKSLAELTGLEAEELEEIKDHNLFEDGILDSLSFVNLISMIEENRNIDIDIAKIDIKKTNTISALVEFMDSLNE